MKEFQLFLSITILTLITIVLSEKSYAQKEGDDISLGKYRILHSEILNEDRKLLIHLPEGYDESNKAYPVFYLLYGNHTTTYFAEAVSVLDRLGSNGRIPEMILVSLENTDRYRDLLPQRGDGSSTGIDHFITFFEKELFPFVEKNYRTKNYRLIMGPQAGANFAFYTLFKNPDLFNAAIISNPFRWTGGRNLNLNLAKGMLKTNKTFEKDLYITCNDNDELEVRGRKFVEEFEKYAANQKTEGFNLYTNYYNDWDEFLAPFDVRNGIKKIFEEYPFPEDKVVVGAKDITDYYKKLSDRYGYQVDVPELVPVFQYDKIYRNPDNEKAAEEILDYIMETNPNSTNGLWRMSNKYAANADLKNAVKCLEKMIELLDSDSGMSQDRVKKYKKMLTGSAAHTLHKEIINNGLDAAKKKYKIIKNDKRKYFDESEFNNLGYQFLQRQMYEEAHFLFEINVEKHPNSANAYDSFGEANFKLKKHEEAEKNYKKSLELNPDNNNAKMMLEEILGLTAKIFLPDIISTPDFNEYGCTFSTDSKEFYFTRTLQNPKNNIIYFSKQSNTGWTKPEPATFIKDPQVGEPIISPDGDLFLFGKIIKDKKLNTIGSEIWYCKKKNEKWSSPKYLFPGMYATISKENIIYFTDISDGFEKADIAKVKFNEDKSEIMFKLPATVNSSYQDAHPYIDPDEQFILFDSDRPGGYGKSDIYISYKINGSWSEPVNLGPQVNTEHYDAIPYISPDGKYLFFCRVMGQGDIYRINASILDDLKPNDLK